MDLSKYLNPRSYLNHLAFRLGRGKTKLRDWLRQQNVPLNRNERRLVEMRRNRKRKRCFIIGNGPSLNAADLEMIADEDSMACNRIFLIYPDTHWRPTYYLAVDPKVVRGIKDEIPTGKSTQIIASDLCSIELPSSMIDAVFVERYQNCKITHLEDREELVATYSFSKNSLEGIEAGWATLFSGIQLAFWLGYEDVILLGVDHSYPKNQSGDPLNYCPEEGGASHFSKDYVSPAVKIDEPNLKMSTAAFAKSAAVFEGAGRRLMNASRKTCLDVVPVCSLESILSED